MTTETFEAARISLTGDRKNNQDRSLILSHLGTTLVALADGLGGHPRGEVAAQLFTDICESLFRREPKPLHDPEQFMMQCIHKAHHAIIRFGDRQTPPVSPRTTAVMAILQADTVSWVHVGDSRLYLMRKGRVLAQTRDHSQVQYIRPSTSAGSKTRSSITRCLGGLDKPPNVTAARPRALNPGDTLMLCSDGLWGQVPQDQLVKALSQDANFSDAVYELTEDAAHRGYPRSDNVTTVAIRWHPTQQSKINGEPNKQSEHDVDSAVRHLRDVLQRPSS